MKIESAQNERLKTVRRLAERKHREQEGMFVSEGEDLLEAGLDAGHEPVFSLVAAGSGLEGIECDPGLLAKASNLGSGTRVITVWRLFEAETPMRPCVFLEGVSDPGNVGTILRTSAALAGGTLCLGPGSADPFSPKAVRASMGAIFASPPLRQADLEHLPGPRTALEAHGGDGLELLAGTGTLCLGAERNGLSDEARKACERGVTIPTTGKIESLNVGAAAAIALHLIASGDSDD